jgi:hypothetical protein
MTELELLIEDYKRRVNTCIEEINKANKSFSVNQEKIERLKVKKSCYKTFLIELEKIQQS